MPIEQLVTLALVQGITEFLPISSSGHLNLVHLLTSWGDQGPMMDVSVHVGTLFAVVIYFRRDVATLMVGVADLVRGRTTDQAQLLLLLALASLPVFGVGFVVARSGLVDDLRTLEVIAWANFVFALVLWVADRYGLTIRRIEHTTTFDALIIGLAQVIALVPGVSRAGVTMTMARLLGYERTDAARFSMLLSIPTIAGLGIATAFELAIAGDLQLQSDAALAAGLSFVSAIAAIWFLMALLRRTTLLVFVVYRLVLSAALFAILYGLIANPIGG